MAERLSCCVPFCRRTRHNREGYREWICAVHWPMVPTRLKRRRQKVDRLYRRRFGNNAFWTYKAGSPERLECVKLDRICAKAWEACKRAAVETAAGI